MNGAHNMTLLLAWEEYRAEHGHKYRQTGECIADFLASRGWEDRQWHGPIRCIECGGTAEEPWGECGGVLHPTPPATSPAMSHETLHSSSNDLASVTCEREIAIADREALDKLMAENARLRAEVDTLSAGLCVQADNAVEAEKEESRLRAEVEHWRSCAFQDQAERGIADDKVRCLTADLARVTEERDALRAAARDVIACDKDLSDALAWNEGHIEERMVAELRMVQSLAPLRLAVEACK